jgi:hypothetical protein
MSPFLVDETNAAGPATHAIVIGVGAYPHLVGGTERLTDWNEGMEQLTSPVLSARALASWLIDNLRDPAKPLATVALLLSETSPRPFRNPRTGTDHVIETASMGNARQALAEWKNRGAGNEDRLLFYFCGHGLGSGTKLALLLSDFGHNENDPLDAAIDFDGFHLGMETCAAREQCFFIDTCRANSDTTLGAGGYMGVPIVKPDFSRLQIPAPVPREAPIFYSTMLGQDAYGKPGRCSPFADALLWALGGAGSDCNEGDWRVSTTGLKRAIDFSMARAFDAGSQRAPVPATNNLTTFYFHYLTAEPSATVFVGCQPQDANPFARLSYRFGGAVQDRPAPSPEDWELDLLAGDYEFLATFNPGGPYAGPARKEWYVNPPYRKVRLEITQ